MKYQDAKKIQIGDTVYFPDTKENHRVLEIQTQEKDIFFRLLDIPHEYPRWFHHRAVTAPKTLDEILGIYLSDPKTRVYIQHNDELGEWRWAVVVDGSDGFWLDSFPTEAEAIQYVSEHGLRYCE